MQDLERRLPRAVLVVALAALVLKLVLATTTQGTNDIRAFWYFLQEYRGSGAKLLYEKESEFNHPPFVIRWLLALRWLSRTIGGPPWFWVRLPAILADFGSVWIVARLVGARLGEAATRFTLLLVAAAPASLMISGFHGNNDPVMIFFVLVSVLLLERRAPFWLAGLAMGMAVNMKVVPLVFWPAICLWLPSWRARFAYFGAAVSAVVVASLPWILEEPALLARKVLLYKSSFGLWGLARILKGSSVFETYGRVLLAATLVGLALWMNRRPERPPLFRQLGVLAFAFLAITPGFGVQYLAWLVPWIAGIAPSIALAWCLASGAFLFLVYTFWCQGVPFEHADPNWLAPEFWSRGLPWVSADANSVGEWRGAIVPVEIACWITVVAALIALLRASARESSARAGRYHAPGMRVLFLTDSLSDLDGVGRYAVRLITALEKARPGLDVRILLARKHRPTSADVPAHWKVSVGLPPDYFFRMAPARFWTSLGAASLRVASAAAGADLVHAIKDYPHSAAGLLGARLRGIPCVATAHGTYSVQPLLAPRHARLARWTYAHLAGLIAVSRFTRDRLVEIVGEAGFSRLRVIPNAVSAEHYAAPSGIGPRAWHAHPFTLSIGEIKERKGHHLALAAFARVAAAHPDVHHYVVGRAGGDGYDLELRDTARAAGLVERVHFLGNVDESEKVDLLQRARVFLLTPVRSGDGGFEGFGLVYLEAAACALPAIGTLGCGAEDAIVDGETGLLVEPRVDAVAGALERLLADSRLAQSLGEAALRRARNSSWDENARSVLALYDEVLGTQDAPRAGVA